MNDRTTAQSIFALVKEEFARGNTRISKSEILEWDVEYIHEGRKKHANGDTKARKLRLLVEANYLGRELDKGQTYIIPATGQPRAIEDTQEDEPEVKPKYRYEPIFEDGKPTGRVRQIEIT
jgi:hypothetical protein